MATMIEQVSTGDYPQKDRLSFWNDVSARMVAPIRVTPANDTVFAAKMQRIAFQNFEIVSPWSSPAVIESERGDFAGTLNLQIQHVGHSTNTTAGKTCALDEGDFVLFDPSQAMRLEFAVTTQVLILRLPLAYVEDRLPRLRRMAGIKISGNRGPGQLFSTFVRNTWTQLQDGEASWASALDDVLWPMLDLAYAEERVASVDTSAREERRRVLFGVIEENLCDPDLDVHKIARRMGVSARYVQMLFAAMATTPTAFIQHQRLDLAGHRLEAGGAHCSITDVAYDVGFNDLSSFCRAFRRRFDVAPREYRAGLRRGQNRAAANA